MGHSNRQLLSGIYYHSRPWLSLFGTLRSAGQTKHSPACFCLHTGHDRPWRPPDFACPVTPNKKAEIDVGLKTEHIELPAWSSQRWAAVSWIQHCPQQDFVKRSAKYSQPDFMNATYDAPHLHRPAEYLGKYLCCSVQSVANFQILVCFVVLYNVARRVAFFCLTDVDTDCANKPQLVLFFGNRERVCCPNGWWRLWSASRSWAPTFSLWYCRSSTTTYAVTSTVSLSGWFQELIEHAIIRPPRWRQDEMDLCKRFIKVLERKGSFSFLRSFQKNPLFESYLYMLTLRFHELQSFLWLGLSLRNPTIPTLYVVLYMPQPKAKPTFWPPSIWKWSLSVKST